MQRTSISILIAISIFLTCSCENENLQSNTDTSIKKLVIKAQPSFHNNSLFICDIVNGDLLFDKLGNLMFLDEEMNHSIVPFSYSFTTLELIYLKDSIINSLNEVDFNDLEAPVMDGISTDILFIFENDEVKKVTLNNKETNAQTKIVDFIFETVIENCSDTSNISYAKRILEYYN